ncbi:MULTISPECIES: hypothetical protein [Tatumella]|uniref:Uncharacterized protein n=1 Tax=Tatumella punctata TaxID=399969 RepID=A0ABW1VKR9_9GAMM|nr:hypothetical protein [Tatumella sp. JGM16]MBS0876217.1 hypothetical protein [Tatumella sp. JGM82]MBS0889266.1 hypothetical protein [Tatumella sp. JGM94]MBS0893610.1 hypothetical protein [Tatumella sp. JGM130]MBS0902320.1 hypothetical protein [Tatumella sp. JGM100]MBS0911479.1 hypothetical protein [Tatumella sp. JGM91]
MSDDKLTSGADNRRICFNYSDFLSASCKKHWSFVDAIYGVLPIFGMVTRKTARNINGMTNDAEHFKAMALQIISTQVSDEINIARLIALAEQQKIISFEIQLPYPLSEHQLAGIYDEYRKPLTLRQDDDCLRIALP